MHSRCSPLTFAMPLCCLTILTISEGCVIPVPLAIYPAQTHDSGKTITFYDQDGKQIQKDGLLVLERDYDGSRQLLDIHGGKVTLPRQCKLSSLWLYWMFGVPWYPCLQEIPGENVRLFPFISGYCHNGLVWSTYFPNDSLFNFFSNIPHFEQESVTLFPNEDAYIYWELQLNEMTIPTRGDAGSDFVLPEPDLERLKSYVEAELKHMKPPPPSTHPVLDGIESQPAYVPTSQPS